MDDDDFLNEDNIKEDNFEDTESSSKRRITGDRIEEKPTLDVVFDTETLLKTLKKEMEGKELINGEYVQVRLPIARDETIALIINSLRSIINPSNLLANFEEERAKLVQWEKILEFEYLAIEDPTIDNNEYETLINMCDHALDLFLSKVIDGHATQTIETIYTGQRIIEETKGKQTSLLGLDFFGTQTNKNIKRMK